MSKVVDINNVTVTERTVEGAEPSIPRKIVPVNVVGTLRDGREVKDRIELQLPQTDTDYTGATAWIWQRYLQAAAISFREPGDRFVIYPLSAFEKLELEFSSVVGVTL